MIARPAALVRTVMFLLVALLGWSLWVSAAQGPETVSAAAPEANAAAATNAPTAVLPDALHLIPNIDRQYLTFGLDRIPMLRDTRFLGVSLWQYGAFGLFVMLAFYAARATDYLTRAWLKRWASKTETRLDDLVLEIAHGPVRIIAFVVLLHIGLGIFDWPPRAEVWLSNGLKLVVAFSLMYAAVKVVDVLVGAWKFWGGADENLEKQLKPLLSRVLKALVVVVGVLMALSNVGVNITGLIASLSIGGLALGLAAQDTVANLFGAAAVLVDKPFQVGDHIRAEGVEGRVEAIGLRSTRIRSLEGFLITIPNKAMGNAIVVNVAKRPTIRTNMTIGLTYNTPSDRVLHATRVLNEIFKAHPKTKDVLISFNAFGDSSVNITVVHWWDGNDHRAYMGGIQELCLEVKRRFDAEGLSFAFPTRTVYMIQEGATPPNGGASRPSGG